MKFSRLVIPSLSLAVSLSLLLLAAGCNVVGAVAYKVAGPQPIEAMYTPAKEPMVVVVERFNAPGSSITESETLAREIFQDLSSHDVAQQIDPVTVINLRDQDPVRFRKLTISQIGAAVTAKQVLYVNLSAASVESVDGGTLFRGLIAARVKVIDVLTGETLWPTDAADGYPVSVEIKPKFASNRSTPETTRIQLLKRMSVSVARLFYKWQPEDEAPQ